MKFFITILLIVAAVAANAAHVVQHQQQHQQQQLTRKTRPAVGFSKASNEFGFELLNEIIKHRSTTTESTINSVSTGSTQGGHHGGSSETSKTGRRSENVVFSPYGVSVALSMVHQGAQGTTGEQFKHLLHYDRVQEMNNGDYQTVATTVKQVQDQIRQQQQQQTQSQTKSSTERFDYGNVLLIDQHLKVKDDYRKTIEQYYDGEVMPVDFQKDTRTIQQRVNQYVSNKTNGLIEHMLEQTPSSSTVLSLINAVYFKGEWLKPFEQMRTEQNTFYSYDGHEYKNVQYLNGDGPYGYVELPELNADLVQIPYKSEDIVFYGILPRERSSNLKHIRQQINSTYVDEIVGRVNRQQEQQEQTTTIYLPKFELQTTIELPEILKSMGLQDVFTERSNLSGITSTTSTSSTTKPKLSNVLHKSKLVVSEQGTEVASTSYVPSTLLSTSTSTTLQSTKTLRFDHPFFYFVRHLPTGQLLFIGEIHDF